MSSCHIAQLNIGVMVAPTDDPAVAEFMDNLDRINAQADDADGFVWRLQTETGNATDIQIFPNPLQLVNMSVWESVDTLKAYVYRSEHVDFFRRRAKWFEADGKRLVLWSIVPGTVPELADAVRRMEFLERHGPSPYAFGFASPPAPLVFETADPGDADTRALIEGSDFEVRPGDRLLSARFDGAVVGVGATRSTGSAGHEVVGATVATSGLYIEEALIDQLELAAGNVDITLSVAQHEG